MTNNQPIYAKLDSIMESKTAIRDAIAAKGVDMTNVELSDYAAKIGEIKAGGLEWLEAEVTQ